MPIVTLIPNHPLNALKVAAMAFAAAGSLSLLIAAGFAAEPPQQGRSNSPQGAKSPARGPGLQYITMEDPGFGIPEGTMPFFVNWHGTANVDRKDNMGDPVDSFTFTSPDGSEKVQQLGRTFTTTVLPQMAHSYPQMKLVKFTSTADLLNRYIIPQMQLGGQPEAATPVRPDKVAMLNQGLPSDMFADAASIKIDNAPGGKEIMIRAITGGHNRGGRGENTSTTIVLCSAPAGQAEALLKSFATLPPMIKNPEWEQRQTQRNHQIQQQTAQSIADFNRRQAAFNAVQEASNKAHRDANTAAFNRNSADVQQQQQNNQDSAAVHIGILSGNPVYFKWCSPDNQASQVTDSTFPPQVGWKRCN